MLNPTEIHLFIYMAKSYRILSLFFLFLDAFFLINVYQNVESVLYFVLVKQY